MKKGLYCCVHKKIAGCMVFLILTFSSAICFAAMIDDLDIKNGVMEISGDVSQNEMVLAEVFKGDYSQSNYLDNLIYISQKGTESGNYEFTFNILNASKGQTGDFTVRISDFSGMSKTRTFYFYPETQTDGLRELINDHINNTEEDSQDIQWLESYFKANKNKLIPSYLPYDDVFENDYTSNFSELYSYEKNALNNSTMKSSIRKVSLLTMLGYSSADEIHRLLKTYGEDLQISDKKSYITYTTELDEDSKKSVAGIMHQHNGPYVTQSDFQKTFDDAVIITHLRQINGTTACQNVLSGYPEYFGNYNATNSHYKKILAGISAGSVSSIGDITNILKVNYPSGGGGGGIAGVAVGGVVAPSAESGILSNYTSSNDSRLEHQSYDYEKAKDFTDLEDFEWAAESINYLRDKGIVNGYSDEIFAPADNVSRAQLCKMLCLALEFNSYDKDSTVFDDVNKKDWYYEYVSILSSLGIVNGTGNGIFEPDKNVTREDMAVMVYRAMKLKNINFEKISKSKFEDSDLISDYATEAVSYLSGEELLNGDNGFFNPKQNATRAETAKFIYSVCIKCGGVK